MKSKSLFVLLLSLLTCINVLAIQIKVDGRDRIYYTYIPNDLGDNKPLLISMHGMNQDANYQKGMLQIESVADTAKFAVVFPEGIDRSWDISGNRDINFVLAIIDDMATRYKIDKNRVYLSGFSMGGMFTYHAINRIADKIAAFAPISGYPMGGQEYTSSRPVPIIHTHGTGDDVVNFGGVQNILNGWIARNGCAQQDLVTKPYRGPHATLHQWGPGDDGVEVVLLELADKGHWIANDYFKTGEEIWNFCKRYSLDAKHPSIKINSPQPSTEIQAIGTQENICLNINITAKSDYADIATVDIYADNNLLGTVTADEAIDDTYPFVWNTMNTGSHLIKVVATDREGNTVARGLPVTAKGIKKNVTLSSKFNDDGIMPKGWLTYNGRNLRIGEQSGFTGGARVVKLTGTPRDFDYALYFHQITNNIDGGYAIYGDPRASIILYLTEGTYEVSFKGCNWDIPELGAIRCKVMDADTDELLGETQMMPTVNIGGKSTNPFSGVAVTTMSFVVHGDRNCKVCFYTEAHKGADAMVTDVKLKKVSSDGIIDIAAEDTHVANVIYYDLQGRKLVNPTPGMVLRQTIYADGKVKTEKIVIR